MCGIFGYICKTPLDIKKVVNILSSLEVQQLPDEKTPVGGHGAGILIITNGKFKLLKTGRESENSDTVKQLSQLIEKHWEIKECNIILGHVRRASPMFIDTVNFSECTQPYIASCLTSDIEVVCSHNGRLNNYKKFINANHHYQSEPYGIIDSEIYPHLLEDMISKGVPVKKIGEKLLDIIEGKNAVSFILRIKKEYYLLIVHKNSSRGLVIWQNHNNEILFCSRELPVMNNLTKFIQRKHFIKNYEILYNQECNLHLLRNITGLIKQIGKLSTNGLVRNA